jgi:hypothetical protein
LLGVRCRRILEEALKEIGVSTKKLIDSSQDGDYWRALVNVALDLLVYIPRS